ncbi:MAG TPA: PqqD family protein [Terracidiphilus sp.]|nr:PqqD family protein [Terracidiphilus sp.]
MEIQPGQFDSIVENHLPDGSRFLVDSENETVYALNATAGAAWDACKAPTSLDNVTAEMQRSIGSAATEELAEAAILQLQANKLVTASGGERRTTRREVLTKLGKVALPIVVAMTLTEQTEQAAYARSGQSKPPGNNPPSGGSDPTCKTIWWWLDPNCW